MNNLTAIFIFVSVFFSFSGEVIAQGMAARGCEAPELVGTWEMINLKSKVKKRGRNPFFSKTQIFIFDEDKTMKILGKKRNNRSKYSDRENKPKEILSAVYSVEGEGVLTLVAEDPKKSEHSLCSYVLEEVKDPEGNIVFEKGDINLTYVDPQNKILAMKALRKIS